MHTKQELDMKKIQENPKEQGNKPTDYAKLCKQLNDGKLQMRLCVPLQTAEDFFNQLLKKFRGSKVDVTLYMPVKNLIKIPRGMEADENSFADLDEEILGLSPASFSGGPKKESLKIKKILNKKMFSETGFFFQITTSYGIIRLEKGENKDHISFCGGIAESFTSKSGKDDIPCGLFSQAMPVLEPYTSLQKKINL